MRDRKRTIVDLTPGNAEFVDKFANPSRSETINNIIDMVRINSTTKNQTIESSAIKNEWCVNGCTNECVKDDFGICMGCYNEEKSQAESQKSWIKRWLFKE